MLCGALKLLHDEILITISTHTASVHKSVSLALKNLNQHYASPVVGTVQEAIARLASLIRIDKKRRRNAVAIRCLQRLARNDEYTDCLRCHYIAAIGSCGSNVA